MIDDFEYDEEGFKRISHYARDKEYYVRYYSFGTGAIAKSEDGLTEVLDKHYAVEMCFVPGPYQELDKEYCVTFITKSASKMKQAGFDESDNVKMTHKRLCNITNLSEMYEAHYQFRNKGYLINTGSFRDFMKKAKLLNQLKRNGQPKFIKNVRSHYCFNINANTIDVIDKHIKHNRECPFNVLDYIIRAEAGRINTQFFNEVIRTLKPEYKLTGIGSRSCIIEDKNMWHLPLPSLDAYPSLEVKIGDFYVNLVDKKITLSPQLHHNMIFKEFIESEKCELMEHPFIEDIEFRGDLFQYSHQLDFSPLFTTRTPKEILREATVKIRKMNKDYFALNTNYNIEDIREYATDFSGLKAKTNSNGDEWRDLRDEKFPVVQKMFYEATGLSLPDDVEDFINLLFYGWFQNEDFKFNIKTRR